jgi:hypothetical protein
MATLNKNPNAGYHPPANPRTPSSGTIAVDYTPKGYASVTGVHSPGKAPDLLVDATQQSATNALVVSPSTVNGTNQADNFLPSTPVADFNHEGVQTLFGTPTENPAQAPSAGKSLSPSHE